MKKERGKKSPESFFRASLSDQMDGFGEMKIWKLCIFYGNSYLHIEHQFLSIGSTCRVFLKTNCSVRFCNKEMRPTWRKTHNASAGPRQQKHAQIHSSVKVSQRSLQVKIHLFIYKSHRFILPPQKGSSSSTSPQRTKAERAPALPAQRPRIPVSYCPIHSLIWHTCTAQKAGTRTRRCSSAPSPLQWRSLRTSCRSLLYLQWTVSFSMPKTLPMVIKLTCLNALKRDDASN